LTDADSALFGDFNAWVDNYNEYIVKEFNKLSQPAEATADELEIAQEFVDVEVEA
jgi:hypothetical protein